MPNECSPEAVNRVVTLTRTLEREEEGVAVVGQGSTVSRAALYLAHINARPQGKPPTPAPAAKDPEKSIWSSVVDFLMEGFANCSTLYPVAHFSAGGLPLGAEVSPRAAFAANERRLSLVPDAPRKAADTNQVPTGLASASQLSLGGSHLDHRAPFDRASSVRSLADQSFTDRVFSHAIALASQEIERPNRWYLLRSCWEVVVTLHAHMRREREIAVAIEALAELDDGLLNDIGIQHRSHIERAVRNGNGC